MYFKLAFRNVRRSLKDYAVYFLTLTFGVCIFYVFNSIEAQQSMMSISSNQDQVFRNLTNIMSYVSIFITFILGFLVLYANGFLIKRRKKELGVYMTLGMDKGQMSLILMLETLVIGVVSLTVGLILGVFLSEGLAVVTAKMFETEIIEFKFIFSPAACGKTCLYFGLIFIIVMVFNSFSISKYKLIDLLSADKVNQTFKMKKLWHSVVIFILSIICLGTAYYLIVENGMININAQFGASLALGCLGTLFFFMSLSGFLLRLVQSNKKLYLKGLNMFVLRQLNSKINTTFVSMSVICVMLLFTIGTLSSGISLADTLTSAAKQSTPYDITITSGSGVDEDVSNAPSHTDIKADLIAQKGINVEDYASEISTALYKNTDVPYGTLLEYDAEDLKNMVTDSALEKIKNTPTIAMSLSDFNALLAMQGKEPLTLKDDEYRIFYDMTQVKKAMDSFANHNQDLTVNGKTLKNGGDPLNITVMTSFSFSNSGTLIIPDQLAASLPLYLSQFNLNFKEPKAATEEAFNLATDGITPMTDGFFIVSKQQMYDQGNMLKIITSYVGIYVGIIFLITSAAILALQQLSEASDNASRYALLRKIGVDEKMINHSLFAQVAIYFMMPLALALVHSVVGIHVANAFIAFFGNIDVASNTGITAVILVLIYGGYFLATYFGSRNMIKS